MIALLPLSEDSCVRLLRHMFRRNRLDVAGFVEVRVAGRSQGRAATLKMRVTFEAGRDYWINAVALATVARRFQPGRECNPESIISPTRWIQSPLWRSCEKQACSRPRALNWSE